MSKPISKPRRPHQEQPNTDAYRRVCGPLVGCLDCSAASLASPMACREHALEQALLELAESTRPRRVGGAK